MSTEIKGRVIHEDVFEDLTFDEVKAMIDVRDLFADPERFLLFDMSNVTRCGTPLCMAGHIAFHLGHTDSYEQGKWYLDHSTQEYEELDALFAGKNPSDRAEAVLAIDHYLATGEGRWPFYDKTPEEQLKVRMRVREVRL